MFSIRNAVTLVATVVLITSDGAGAQITGGVLRETPDARAVAMGGAGAAIHWTTHPASWTNPAHLSRTRGISWQHSASVLVPQGTSDILLTGDRMSLGGRGFGFEAFGVPLGGLVHEQESLPRIPSDGTRVSVLPARTSVEGWAAGLDVWYWAREWLGMSAPWADRLQMSVGLSRRVLDITDNPFEWLGQPASTASTTVHDFGLLAVVDVLRRSPEANWDVTLDASYGFVSKGSEGAEVVFEGDDVADQLPYSTRHGVGVRIALHSTSVSDVRLSDTVAVRIQPVLEVGMAVDFERYEWWAFSDELTRRGVELRVLNLLSLRRGNSGDEQGFFDPDSNGWSFGLEFQNFGGFRVDRATWERGWDGDEAEATDFTIWIDVASVVGHRSAN